RAELDAAAGRLTKARTAASRRMEKAVAAELQGLRLEASRFGVALRPLAEAGPGGAEAAEMMFSANPGEPIAPLAKVASGGELAREDEKARELARMMSGGVTPKAVARAHELLEEAGRPVR